MPDTVGSDHHQPTFLQARANKVRVNERHRFRDLYRCLNVELLRHCWHDLKKDAASGADQVTAEVDAEHLHTHSEALV